MKIIRRCLGVALLCLGFVAWAAMPASAQVDVRYTGPGVVVPTITPPSGPLGAVLSETGQRTETPPQFFTAQLSGGVAGTAQARTEGLAFTGADIVTLVAIGLSALMLGLVLNRRARPRSVAN
jgi:hypothetical protein